MPLTSSDFVLRGATPQDVADLNAALAYLQTTYGSTAVLNFNQGATINFVHNGVDHYSTATDVIDWDPRSGLGVHNNGVTGVQSAALGLYHEMVHRADPNIRTEPVVLAEIYATSMETLLAGALHEPTRESYGATDGVVALPDTTEHTDHSHWQQVAPNGNVVVVGAYDDTHAPTPPPPPPEPTPPSGGGGGGGGCVSVDSLLPDGRMAGQVTVGSMMQLGDEQTLSGSLGEVTYSERKTVPGYRIVTQSGVSLKCSDTAPIPTPEGLVLAPDLLGKKVPVRRDDDGVHKMAWEIVEKVESIGVIEVQHITVGDRCFWAGERAGAYILHHNLKDAGGGPDDPDDPDDPDWDFATAPSGVAPAPAAKSMPQLSAAAHQAVAVLETAPHNAAVSAHTPVEAAHHDDGVAIVGMVHAAVAHYY